MLSDSMLDPVVLALVGLTFLLAGGVKGVIGLGLPTVSLAVLTAILGLQPAMALLLVPSFVTNLWQAVVGGNGRDIIARLWPFFLAATITVWIGALALTTVDVALLSALLGAILVLYSAANLGRLRITIPQAWESWLGPIVGTVNGVLTGMTGSFVVPGVLYLQAVGLPRDMLIQAMGMLFTLSTVALAVSLGTKHLLTLELGAISTAAVLPAIVGMIVGQRLRKNITEKTFRHVFFISLLLIGAYIIVRSLAR
jgi:uncharacterized membrane protein YfcA